MPTQIKAAYLIDTMGFSKTSAKLLLAAGRFFGYFSRKNEILDPFRYLVQAPVDQQRGILTQDLFRTYPFHSDELLAEASYKTLYAQFLAQMHPAKATKATAKADDDVVVKEIRFYVNLAASLGCTPSESIMGIVKEAARYLRQSPRLSSYVIPPDEQDTTASDKTVPLRDLPLTKEDFVHANWQVVIATCTPRVTTTCAQLFFDKANEIAAVGDRTQEAVYALLGTVCSPYMDLDDPKQPFRPAIVLSDGTRSASVEDLTDEQLKVLAEIFPTITDPELRARVADMLWIRKCKYVNNPGQWARIATTAYLDSARVLEDPLRFTHCVHRIERALQLIASSGDNQVQFNQLITYIEALLTKYSDDEQKFFFYDLMKLLLERKQGDPAKYASLAQKIAKSAEDRHDWYMAAFYWRTKAQWHQLAGDSDAAGLALVCEAETFVQDATDATQASNPSYIRASSLLYQAIAALEQLPDTSERRKQLKTQLHEWQRKSASEMKRMGLEVDTSDFAERARNEIRGKPFGEALWNLVRITASPNWDVVRQFVNDSAVQFPLTYLIPASITTGEGRWTAHIAPLGKDASQKAILDHMFRAAQQFQLTNVFCFIDPARIQMLQEHFIRVEDFLPFLLHSPFVPPSRVRTYARGLYAGFIGDFLVAAHLLVPQLENSLRYILQEGGEIVTSLDSKGIQNENGINKLFEDHQERLEQLIGRDITYDLRGLLAEHAGTNLRNRLSHGLLDDAVFMDSLPYHAIYLWWLTLRLVILTYLSNQPHPDSD